MKPLTKEQIDQAFTGENHQYDILTNLYKIAFPQWNSIQTIDGWPNINKETWKYICDKFIEFDKIHHPNVMAGGLWLNKGFSSNPEKGLVEEWMIDISTSKIIYRHAKISD